MSFFEPPSRPPIPEPPEPAPPWLGPPDDVLGQETGLGFLLARSTDVAIGVGGITAFPDGFLFRTVLRRRHPVDERWEHPWPHGPWTGRGPPEDDLRLGVQLSDGRRATTLDPLPTDAAAGDAPTPLVLIHRGGGGGGRAFDHDFWVWPLPPPGALAFVCEWQAQGIALTRLEIDAAPIREASQRARRLWDAPEG